jgi:hypothetical protein
LVRKRGMAEEREGSVDVRNSIASSTRWIGLRRGIE